MLMLIGFIKLLITLTELFVSPKDSIELPIDVEGQDSRLILTIMWIGCKRYRNFVIVSTQNRCCFCSISCHNSIVCVSYALQELQCLVENLVQTQSSLCEKYRREDCFFCQIFGRNKREVRPEFVRDHVSIDLVIPN